MERLAVVAPLKPEAAARAIALLADGPPFDLGEAGIARHAVYVSPDEVVFVFEGPEIEWVVDELVSTPFQGRLTDALDAWRDLLAAPPKLARPAFAWEKPPSAEGRFAAAG